MREVPNMHPDLSDKTLVRLNQINEIKDLFIAETRERELMSKKRSKYIAAFDYFDKNLTRLFICHKQWSIYRFFCLCYWDACKDSKRRP